MEAETASYVVRRKRERGAHAYQYFRERSSTGVPPSRPRPRERKNKMSKKKKISPDDDKVGAFLQPIYYFFSTVLANWLPANGFCFLFFCF